MPRSYVAGITIAMDDWPAVELSPGHYELTQTGFPDRHVWFDFKDEFVAWSSNRYTLDWILRCSYFQNTLTLAYVPLAYALSVWYPPDIAGLFIFVSVPGFGTTRRDNFNIANAPADYWALPIPPWIG